MYIIYIKGTGKRVVNRVYPLFTCLLSNSYSYLRP